jgi:hypothetical protein
MLMCLHLPKERVKIKKKIGYACTTKIIDWDDKHKYVPIYFPDFRYELGIRYVANRGYQGNDVIDKRSENGGFYFFHSKASAKKFLLNKNYLKNRDSIYRVKKLVVKCLFEDVFEKGKWDGHVAYRAKFRTILEDVSRR